jgi:hypothetical protein
MNIARKLEKSKDFWFLIVSFLTFFILRLPSLLEPYWYGDEGIYESIGVALNHGSLLYRDIFDNKPPLLYYTYSLFDSDQFLVKLLSLITGILAIIGMYFLSKKLLKIPKAYRLVTFLFTIIFGLPIIEGNIANAENFMIPLSIFALLFILKYLEGNKSKLGLLFLSGLILGISFIFKIVAVFDFAAFFLFLFIFDFPEQLNFQTFKKQIMNKFPALFVFTVSFIIPYLITLVYFAINKSVGVYLTSMFFSNIGYVGYGNKFIIPQGLLILKLGLLGISVSLIFLKRRSLEYWPVILILLWTVFSIFNAFFSQRPYPHYLLVLLPSFCLLFGSIFAYKRLQKFLGLTFVIIFLLVWFSFSFYMKSFQYYSNFISFISGNKSVAAYQSYFDRKTPRDYAIASFINANTNSTDNIFMWGNNAQVYKMTGKIPPGKYTVLYHIVQYKDAVENTNNGLMKKNPKYIVIMPNNPTYPFPLFNYQAKINIGGATIYERNN